MEMLLHSRNRHDPRMSVLQMKAGLLRLHRPRFHQNNAGNDLQAIADAMLQFLQQDVLLPYEILLFALQGALLGDILYAEQNGRIGTSLIEHLPCVQAHRTVSEAGKLMFDLIALYLAMFGYDFFQQHSKLRNVPLAI